MLLYKIESAWMLVISAGTNVRASPDATSFKVNMNSGEVCCVGAPHRDWPDSAYDKRSVAENVHQLGEPVLTIGGTASFGAISKNQSAGDRGLRSQGRAQIKNLSGSFLEPLDLVKAVPGAARARTASVIKFLRQDFGPKWFAKRFHRNVLVTHFDHGQSHSAAGCMKNGFVILCRSPQCASQR